jgi:hypothetical protein
VELIGTILAKIISAIFGTWLGSLEAPKHHVKIESSTVPTDRDRVYDNLGLFTPKE